VAGASTLAMATGRLGVAGAGQVVAVVRHGGPPMMTMIFMMTVLLVVAGGLAYKMRARLFRFKIGPGGVEVEIRK